MMQTVWKAKNKIPTVPYYEYLKWISILSPIFIKLKY